MKDIEALSADGGDVALEASYLINTQRLPPTATTGVAMLLRRKCETLSALLKRLDIAIANSYDNGETIDEINSIRLSCQVSVASRPSGNTEPT